MIIYQAIAFWLYLFIETVIAFSYDIQARHVSWTFKGYEINTNNNPDYSIIEEPLPDGIKSILIIRESQSKHFGQYNCTVVNEHGNDVMEIELLRQGMGNWVKRMDARCAFINME